MEQLKVVLDHSVVKRYYKNNPLAAYMKTTDQERDRIQVIREQRVKRSFTRAEEIAILKNLHLDDNPDVIELGALICYFAGTSTGETCALIWGDYIRKKSFDMVQLNISKTFKGRKTEPEELSSEYKYRLLVLASRLQPLLEKRYQTVLSAFREQGIPEDQIKSAPIISGENVLEPIKRSVLRDRIKEAVKAADIEEYIVRLPKGDEFAETDLNAFYGEIFAANFDYNMRKIFELGELYYYEGKQVMDTASRHYLDFRDDFIQKKLQIKLERWAGLPLNSDEEPVFNENLKVKDKKVKLKRKSLSGRSKMRLVFSFRGNRDQTVVIKAHAKYGFKLEAEQYPRKER